MPRNKILKDKNEIIDAAMKLIEEEGISSVSMRRLSKDMGVSSMTLYNYVHNTQDILREILIRSFNKIFESMYELMRDLSANGVSGVRAYAYSYALSLYRFTRAERDICAYLIADGREAFHDDAELRPFYNPFNAFLMQLEDREFAARMELVCRLYEGAVRSIIGDYARGVRQLDEETLRAMISCFIEGMFPPEHIV
jgi:AcrR family transcriptional regulator